MAKPTPGGEAAERVARIYLNASSRKALVGNSKELSTRAAQRP